MEKVKGKMTMYCYNPVNKIITDISSDQFLDMFYKEDASKGRKKWVALKKELEIKAEGVNSYKTSFYKTKGFKTKEGAERKLYWGINLNKVYINEIEADETIGVTKEEKEYNGNTKLDMEYAKIFEKNLMNSFEKAKVEFFDYIYDEKLAQHKNSFKVNIGNITNAKNFEIYKKALKNTIEELNSLFNDKIGLNITDIQVSEVEGKVENGEMTANMILEVFI